MSGLVDRPLPGRAFEDKERGLRRTPIGAGAVPGPGAPVIPGPIQYRNMPFTAKTLANGGNLVVLPANASRVYLNIQNQGGTNVYVAFGGPNGGMFIGPSNGFEWAYNAPQNTVYVYTAGGTSDCILIEGVR